MKNLKDRFRVINSPAVTKCEVPFGEWVVGLAKSIKLALSAGILGAATSWVCGLLLKRMWSFDPGWVLPAVCGIQFSIIFLLVLLTRFAYVNGFSVTDDEGSTNEAAIAIACGHSDPQKWESVKSSATTALRHYINYWMSLWLCWLTLYALFIFQNLPGMNENLPITYALKIAVTFVNNCATVAFLFCFLTLWRPDDSKGKGAEGRQSDWPTWVATLVVLTVIEAACVAIVTAYPDLFEKGPKGVSQIFSWVSGCGSATVMALYTGRLANEFLACPTWAVVLLYAYAGVQAMYGLLGRDNLWGTALILNIALVLKVLLYLYITWALRYGRLLYYFVRIMRLRESADRGMRNFSLLLDK